MQLDYRWQPVWGWAGLAFTQGVHVGGFVGTTYRGFDLGAGDRYYPFVLDTDVFDRSYIFYGRGVSFGTRAEGGQLTLFAGLSGNELSTPFLRAYQTERATGMIFYERRFSPRVTYHSFNILRREVTSIQSLSFLINPRWKVAAAGGVGANAGFFAAASQFKHKWLDLTGSYTINSDRFRRMRIDSLPYPERTGGNLRLQLSPLRYLGLQLNHETILSPMLGSPNSLRATLNSASLSSSLQGFSITAAATQSRGGAFQTTTNMVTVSRNFADRVSSYAAFLRIRTQSNRPANLYVLTVEEKLSSRFAVRQTFTHTDHGKTLSWGGRFLSNRFSLGVDYQTVFNPLAGGFNGRTFVQAWAINAQIQIPRGISLHYNTFVDPFGKFRYTAFLSGITYSAQEQLPGAPKTSLATLGHYLIKGNVEDESGHAVWGIAIQIDSQFVYSDSLGQFYIRVSHRGKYPLSVSSGNSLNPGRWELVNAPSTTSAEPESSAKPVRVVVRRSAKIN